MYRKLLESNVQLPKDKLKELACQLSKVDGGVDDRIDFYKEAGELLDTLIDTDKFINLIFEYLKKKNWNKNERSLFIDKLQKQFELRVVLYLLLKDNEINNDD